MSDHTNTTAAAAHGSDESPLVCFRVECLSREETLDPSKTTTDINLTNTKITCMMFVHNLHRLIRKPVFKTLCKLYDIPFQIHTIPMSYLNFTFPSCFTAIK